MSAITFSHSERAILRELLNAYAARMTLRMYDLAIEPNDKADEQIKALVKRRDRVLELREIFAEKSNAPHK